MDAVDAARTPWWRDGRTWILVLLTAASLAVGWQWKSECHDKPWDCYQWTKMCSSDSQALYGSRGAADGTWPYVDYDAGSDSNNEYPPVTGLYMHFMGEWTHSRDAYLAATATGLGVLALATTVLLGELVGRDRKVLYWALAPALVAYAFYNWDLLAIAPALGALLAFRKERYLLAGALLGLGASAKLFPAFLAPALGLWILRKDRGLRRNGWEFGLAFVAVWAAIHVPFLLLNREGTMHPYTFQAGRAPNFETVWFALGHLGRAYHSELLDMMDDKPVYEAGAFLLLAALAFSGWASFTRRLDPVAAAVLPVLAFLAFNKVYSLQYTLWAIPLLVVVPVPRTLKALVVVADLAVFITLAQYFALNDDVSSMELFTPAAIAVVFRASVWVAVFVAIARPAWRPTPPPAPAATEASA